MLPERRAHVAGDDIVEQALLLRRAQPREIEGHRQRRHEAERSDQRAPTQPAPDHGSNSNRGVAGCRALRPHRAGHALAQGSRRDVVVGALANGLAQLTQPFDLLRQCGVEPDPLFDVEPAGQVELVIDKGVDQLGFVLRVHCFPPPSAVRATVRNIGRTLGVRASRIRPRARANRDITVPTGMSAILAISL